MESLQIVSIVLEVVIVFVALMIAIDKRKFYGYGFFITFAIYVYYDSVRYFGWQFLSSWLHPLFFVATLSALFSIISLYRRR